MPITLRNSSSSVTQFVLTTGLLMKMIASVSTQCASGGPQFASRVHPGGLSQHPCASGGPQFAPRVHQGGLSLHPVCIRGASVSTRVHPGGLSLHPVCIRGASVCTRMHPGGLSLLPVCIRGIQAMQHGVHVMMSTKVSNACTWSRTRHSALTYT